jgi:hypothetical protein
MDISIIVAMWIVPIITTGIQTGTFQRCEGCSKGANKPQGFVDIITRLTSNVIYTSAAIIISCVQIIDCKEKIELGGYLLDSVIYLLLVGIIFIAFCVILTTVKKQISAKRKIIKSIIPICLLLVSLGLSFLLY